MPSRNRFSILSVDSIPEIDEFVKAEIVPTPNDTSETTSTKKALRPKWERRLPPQFVISHLEESEDRRRSLFLKIELQATDTGEVKSVKALLDSGATGMFIDQGYVKTHKLSTIPLSKPILVRNVDGTPNEGGSIKEVVELVLRYKNHSEKAFFAVSTLGAQDVILGHTWLHKHNPDINWATGEVKMSRCSGPCCSGCKEEIRTAP